MFIGLLRKVSFIDKVAGQNPQIHPTPLSMMLRALKTKPKGFGVDWDAYGTGDNALQPIHRSKKVSFVQCILLDWNGNNYYAQGAPMSNVVFMLPTSAKKAFEAILEEEAPDFQGDPTDYAKRFKYGGLLDPQNGCAIRIVGNEGNVAARPAAAAGLSINPSAVKSTAYQPSGQSTFKAYKVYVDEPCPVPVSFIHKIWKDWDKALWYMQPDEQVELLCTAFPADIMRAVFTGTGLLPSSVEKGKTVHLPEEPPVGAPTVCTVTEPVVDQGQAGGFKIVPDDIVSSNEPVAEDAPKAAAADEDESQDAILVEIQRAKAEIEQKRAAKQE
jgi:hypothetical protein